ncbi:hypothetical protein D3C76_1540900 [compost metagenome]
MNAITADHALLFGTAEVVGEVALGEVHIAVDLQGDDPADAVFACHVLFLLAAAVKGGTEFCWRRSAVD